MSSTSNNSFSSDLLNVNEQEEVNAALPVLTPEGLETLFNVFNEATNHVAVNEATNNEAEPTTEKATVSKAAAGDDFEADGVDNLLQQVMDRHEAEAKAQAEAEAKEQQKKITIISDVSLIKPVLPQGPMLKNILNRQRSIITKNAKKYYALKKPRRVAAAVALTVEEDAPISKRSTRMEEAVPEPLSPIIQVVHEGKQGMSPNHSERSVTPERPASTQSSTAEADEENVSTQNSVVTEKTIVTTQSSAAAAEEEQYEVPTFDDDAFTVSQTNIVSNFMNYGAEVRGEIDRLKQYRANLVKKLEWADKKIKAEEKKLEYMNKIKF